MDWFSWLSRTNLEPTITYEYALAFARNELGHEDIPYLDHPFLQSMGISVAKHRLEILKLAVAETSENSSRVARRPVMWLRLAAEQTKCYLIKKIETLVRKRRHEKNSPLSLVPPSRRNSSMRWKVAMLQRNKRLGTPVAKPKPSVDWDWFNVLTKGNPDQSWGSTGSSGWGESEVNGDDEWGNHWSSSFGKTMGSQSGGESESWSKTREDNVKWDSLFKNLKPT